MIILLLAIAALVVVGCGDDADDSGDGSGPDPTVAETGAEAPAPEGDEGESDEKSSAKKPKPDGKAIKTSSSQFGDVLFDENDRAIYIFDKEKTSESECYGDCAVAWPPVLTKGEPAAKGAIKQGKLGTTKRDDGSLQVTYAGQPLYYYVDDPRGEVLCHNVPGFGGLWLAIDAAGDPV